MSPSAIHSTMSDSRERPPSWSKRKSCDKCTAGKRKCDREWPSCSRCRSTRFPCKYSQIEEVTNIAVTPAGSESTEESFGHSTELQAMEEIELQLQLPTTSDLRRGLAKGDCCTMLYTDRGPGKELVDFWSAWFKRLPAMLIKEGKSPFIHMHLYRQKFPRVAQDMHAAMALYVVGPHSARSRVILETYTTELLRTYEENEKRFDSLDRLACVQALFMYHVIGVYDGDIRQRALTDTRLQTLEKWTYALQDDLKTHFPPLGSAEAIICDWDSWLLAESMRRTILLTALQLTLYEAMKTGLPNQERPPTAIEAQNVCLQAKLWSAGTAVEFRTILWRDDHYVCAIEDVEHFIRNATASDADELAVVMVTGCSEAGLDPVRRWLENLGNRDLLKLVESLNT